MVVKKVDSLTYGPRYDSVVIGYHPFKGIYRIAGSPILHDDMHHFVSVFRARRTVPREKEYMSIYENDLSANPW